MDITWDRAALADVQKAMETALEQTAEWIMADVRKSKTIPKKFGVLQGEAISVVVNATGVEIMQNTPYARRLYYHPEYNFQTSERPEGEKGGFNPNARAGWWEPYINGDKREQVKQQFLKACKRNGLEVKL